MRGKCRCTMCLREESEGSLFAFDREMLCHRCLEEETTLCDRCGEPVWRDDAICDRNRTLCRPCFAGQNPRRDCRESLVQQQPDIIHDYPYRPTPVLYGTGDRFLGVELEIDGGGEIPWKALAILRVANRRDRLVYCKHDSSLDNGFELVTHPMTLDFHKNRMPWGDILAKAQALGYVSHHAGTCGLHVHVNRSAFGATAAEQDGCIARVLYFFEKHWEELLRFSRRTQQQSDRWSARYGLMERPKDILSEAKGGRRYGRYTCVNLANPHTIEFRMFRGTLKRNTLIATLQLVDRICDVAISFSDEELKRMSWMTFASGCTEPELVRYMKEHQLYVHGPAASEAET